MIAEIAKWTLVSLFALGCLFTITAVGQPRKPLTGGTAAFVVFMNAVYVVLIVVFWRNS